MTIKALSEYLQIPQSRIRSLVKQKGIPFHDHHGFLRFHRPEIDEWMKTPVREDTEDTDTQGQGFLYRGKPIKSYRLTASKILMTETAWNRLPEFIKKTVEKINEIDRNYLLRKEFAPIIDNYNDYLRVSCQLGLIEKEKGDGREKHYYPTDYAEEIYAAEEDLEEIRGIILRSILHIVENKMELKPYERHAILLLWYFLKIGEKRIQPEEKHFRKDGKRENNFYPHIRLAFTKSLYGFLLNNKNIKTDFLTEWKQFL